LFGGNYKYPYTNQPVNSIQNINEFDYDSYIKFLKDEWQIDVDIEEVEAMHKNATIHMDDIDWVLFPFF